MTSRKLTDHYVEAQQTLRFYIFKIVCSQNINLIMFKLYEPVFGLNGFNKLKVKKPIKIIEQKT